jgi:hypothetical protein
MTLRYMIPEWWCKFSLSFTDYCKDNYGELNWLDFTLGEFFFSILVIVILWVVYVIVFSALELLVDGIGR